MIKIQPHQNIFAEISVPGSKSYTHRMAIASALSDGLCTVTNPLESEDTLLTIEALKQLGVGIETYPGYVRIHGTKGALKAPLNPIYLGNSGTSMRLLAAVAALADGHTTLIGTERMHQRPIADLLDGLKQTGVAAASLTHNGCPPIRISGGSVSGGQVRLNCSLSSQYLSALLLIAPYTQNGIQIIVTDGPVSKPYIDMTVGVMAQLGVEVARDGYQRFEVNGKQIYKAGSYEVEPDCSNASYFWAAAAITGGTVKVKGIRKTSRQGDIRLTEIFEKMGCRVTEEPDGLTVSGRAASAVDVDMADMPDMVPTLAVVAAFANGTTIIRNVAHLKAKESDRLAAVATELYKMGIEAIPSDNDLTIKGGTPHGAEIETYNDHRIAMCFAIAGLKVPGIVIKNPNCVEKSFPNFWEVFNRLRSLS